MEFDGITVLIRNFILLAYADIFNERRYDMIGTTKDTKVLVIYSYNYENNKYENVYKEKFEYPIFSVVPGAFEETGKTSLVIALADNKEYKNIFMKLKIDSSNNINTHIQDLEYSMFPPMSITDYETAMPAVIIGKDKEVVQYSYCVKTGKMKSKSIVKLDDKICKNHPYSFVDIDGDLKAELLITVEKNDINPKWLYMYKYEFDGFKKKYEFNLPNGENGPILFGDFTHKGMNSMVFVNKDTDDKYCVHLFINNLSRHNSRYYKTNKSSVDIEAISLEIFVDSDTKHIATAISDLLPEDHIPVFNINFTGEQFDESANISGGIFATDIDLDGFIEVFVTAKNTHNQEIILPLKLNRLQTQFEIYVDLFGSYSSVEVKSFSTIDYNNKGKETIILNRIKDGDIVVESCYNKFNESNMKLSLTTTIGENKLESYTMGLPGASYLLLSNHGQQLYSGFNSGSGPFLSLISQTTLIGIGGSTYIVNGLRIGIPSQSKEYKDIVVISTEIIQNLDLIITIKKHGKYKIEAFFKIVKYAVKIVIVLLFAGIANVLVWIIISYRHYKKRRMAKTKDSMHPLFRSL